LQEDPERDQGEGAQALHRSQEEKQFMAEKVPVRRRQRRERNPRGIYRVAGSGWNSAHNSSVEVRKPAVKVVFVLPRHTLKREGSLRPKRVPDCAKKPAAVFRGGAGKMEANKTVFPAGGG
jgi:hypothetical protein